MIAFRHSQSIEKETRNLYQVEPGKSVFANRFLAKSRRLSLWQIWWVIWHHAAATTWLATDDLDGCRSPSASKLSKRQKGLAQAHVSATDKASVDECFVGLPEARIPAALVNQEIPGGDVTIRAPSFALYCISRTRLGTRQDGAVSRIRYYPKIFDRSMRKEASKRAGEQKWRAGKGGLREGGEETSGYAGGWEGGRGTGARRYAIWVGQRLIVFTVERRAQRAQVQDAPHYHDCRVCWCPSFGLVEPASTYLIRAQGRCLRAGYRSIG